MKVNNETLESKEAEKSASQMTTLLPAITECREVSILEQLIQTMMKVLQTLFNDSEFTICKDPNFWLLLLLLTYLLVSLWSWVIM